MRVVLSAGEVSGDVAAARVAVALRVADPETALCGIGGTAMAAAGVEILYPTSHLGAVGVTEAVGALPALVRSFAALRRRVVEHRPDVALLVGNDLFNVALGRWLRARGVPTVSYFPPQVWLWRAVAHSLARSFDLILTSFPEEHAVYSAAATPPASVEFVGHYLARELRPPDPQERAAARREMGVSPAHTVVGLLPGSRRHEVRRLAPLLLDTARELAGQRSHLTFLRPVADPWLAPGLADEVRARGLEGRVRLLEGQSRSVMRAANVLLVASGTATLEAALMGVPMVIVYRVSPGTHSVVRLAIALRLIHRDTVGLPNLILGRGVVPELTQARAAVPTLLRETVRLLDEPLAVSSMLDAFGEIRSLLDGGGVDAAARAVRALATTAALHRGNALAPTTVGEGSV